MGLLDAPASRVAMRAYMTRMRPVLALTDEARLAVGRMFAPRGPAPTTTKVALAALAALRDGNAAAMGPADVRAARDADH